MSSSDMKMAASTNAIKPNSKVINAVETSSVTTPKITNMKHEFTSATLMSNGIAKLSSLTPARDLTLGGRGGLVPTNKKVFLPNLNVVRNKNTNVKTSKDTTICRGRGRGRGTERGSRGGYRGGRGGSNLIQTAGVFSEGAGAVNIRPSAKSSNYSKDLDETASAMRKPTLVKSEKKLDVKAVLAKDIEILKSLDDANDDEEIEQKTDFDKIPVQLNEAKWKYVKSEIKMDFESNDQRATVESKEDALAIASQMQSLHVAQQLEQHSRPLPRYPQTLTEFLNNTEPNIFLMQLPDTLPCVEDDSDSPETSPKSSTSGIAELTQSSSPSEKKKKAIRSNVLKKMEEGQVGRLIRYKSGKTKLILGDSYFDLDIGMETGFLQDLMSITCNREERSGNMINLGPIQAKITATPDWENLLKHPLKKDQHL